MRITNSQVAGDNFEQIEHLGKAIRSLSLRYRSRMGALLEPLGIHPGQDVLLIELAQRGPMIQAQLSDALGCEPPSITLMTTKLEAAGYIERKTNAADKRASVVALTERGKAVANKIKDIWRQSIAEVTKNLDDNTIASLPELLITLANNCVETTPCPHGMDPNQNQS